MSKSYKVFPRTLTMGEKKGQIVYSVRPVSYGTLYLRFITNKAVSEPKKANANLVKSISLVKYSEDNDPNGDNNPTDKLRVGCG